MRTISLRSAQERQQNINNRAIGIVKYLRTLEGEGGLVDKVYYCDDSVGVYDSLARGESTDGYGGLFSFTLNKERIDVENFYDSLRLCKGPSLGTNFTLCMAYVMLAHYDELDFVESEYGVRRDLLRVSVGVDGKGGDEGREIIEVFREAFAAAAV